MVTYFGDHCPKCNCPQHYILNASMPCIVMCEQCEHTWNPYNQRQKPTEAEVNRWENEGGTVLAVPKEV